MRWSRVLAVLSVAIGVGGGIAPLGDAANRMVAIPDTPAGRQLSWFMEALDAGEQLPISAVPDHFAPGIPQRPSGIVRSLWMASEALAPATLVEIESAPSANEILAVVRDRDGLMHRLTLETDPSSGHRIREWSVRPGEPIRSNEIGGMIWNHGRQAPLSGTEMELVDAATGTSFTPSVRCRTDFAGYCRFAVPDGAGPVAVKVTNRILWGQMDTYNFPVESGIGSDQNVFDAIPPNSTDFFAGRAGLTPDASQGHLYGILVYVDSETGKVLGRAGCGHVEVKQRPARVFYTKDSIDPDPSRNGTSSSVSAWWIFNLDPGPHTLTARIGDITVEKSVAVVQPGTFGFVRIPIAWDRSVPLPGCE